MRGYSYFPFDPDTLEIINELEIIYNLPHKDCSELTKCQLTKYINQIILIITTKYYL